MSARELIPTDEERDRFARTVERYENGQLAFNPDNVQTYLTQEGRVFRAYADVNHASDAVVIVPAEYGNGLPIEGVEGLDFQFIRAQMVRESIHQALGEEAERPSLVFFPNNGYGQNNHNFSYRELRELSRGSFQPYAARLESLIEHERFCIDDKTLIITGFSQGAALGIDYFARYGKQKDGHHKHSLIAVDTPDRVTPVDFAVSGFELRKNRKNNNLDAIGVSPNEIKYWAKSILTLGNIATAQALSRYDTCRIYNATDRATFMYGTRSPVSSEAKHCELSTKGYPVYYTHHDHSLSSLLDDVHGLAGLHVERWHSDMKQP